MRLTASFLLCCVALSASAAEIWRWRDASGAVHYSDKPMPGAERVGLSIPDPASPDTAAAAPMEEYQPSEPPPPRPQPFAYAACVISSPAPDETFRGVQPVDIRLRIDPDLQPGHTVRVLYDGSPVAGWPPESLQHSLPEVFRGSHTLSVRVFDENGRSVCAGPSVTFHLQQTSVLPPAGQAPRPRSRPPG
jgi:hypothetical protein